MRSMNKTFLIFRHEFSHMIKRIGFIIMTLIVPLLALLGIVVLHIVSEVQKPAAAEEIKIGYVDETGGFNMNTSQGNVYSPTLESRMTRPRRWLKGMSRSTLSSHRIISQQA